MHNERVRQDRIAQWISAFDFGSKGRGFDSHCGRRVFLIIVNMHTLISSNFVSDSPFSFKVTMVDSRKEK